MVYNHSTLSLVLNLVKYYLYYGIIIPIAYLFNQSYLLQHPNRPFPTIISPALNNTIHSFFPNSHIQGQLPHPLPPSPSQRHWSNPQELQQRIMHDPPLTCAIILQGPLSGPPLRQGMIIMQQDSTVYIQEEIGRWPCREDFIATHSVNLQTGTTFRLFIPAHQTYELGIQDDTPRSPFRTPITLTELINHYRAMRSSPPSPPSNV